MLELLVESCGKSVWLSEGVVSQRKICGLPSEAVAARDEFGSWSLVLEDSKTKIVDGKELPPSDFAFVGDRFDLSTWKLPIHDADHVRAALARFNQTQGIPADKKDAVLGRIKAAAKKFGIDASN